MHEQQQLMETIKDREAAPILLGMRNATNGLYESGEGQSEVRGWVGLCVVCVRTWVGGFVCALCMHVCA